MHEKNIRDCWQDIIGESENLKKVVNCGKMASPADCTIVVSGESGTGKELFARAIHNSSPRRNKPFVAVNCAAISKDLLESELFGHVQGAFTTAVKNRSGRFQIADEGTIFLDEIGDLPFSLQGKLLRVLQFKEFSAVGESKLRKVDVRVVAATNANLAKMVREGTFRRDLYYRLNVINLHLPTLRERTGDIEELVSHFLDKISTRLGRDIPEITKNAIARLKTHTWPGNVRELENAIEHAMIISMGETIDEQHLPTLDPLTSDDLNDFISPLTDDGINLQDVLKKIEARYINMALSQTSGNKNKAANLLGLNRTTLVEKIKRGLPEELSVAV